MGTNTRFWGQIPIPPSQMILNSFNNSITRRRYVWSYFPRAHCRLYTTMLWQYNTRLRSCLLQFQFWLMTSTVYGISSKCPSSIKLYFKFYSEYSQADWHIFVVQQRGMPLNRKTTIKTEICRQTVNQCRWYAAQMSPINNVNVSSWALDDVTTNNHIKGRFSTIHTTSNRYNSPLSASTLDYSLPRSSSSSSNYGAIIFRHQPMGSPVLRWEFFPSSNFAAAIRWPLAGELHQIPTRYMVIRLKIHQRMCICLHDLSKCAHGRVVFRSYHCRCLYHGNRSGGQSTWHTNVWNCV